MSAKPSRRFSRRRRIVGDEARREILPREQVDAAGHAIAEQIGLDKRQFEAAGALTIVTDALAYWPRPSRLRSATLDFARKPSAVE